MSWDISIQNLPPDAQTLGEIPDDFEPLPLGPRGEVIQRIQDVIPEIDFSDASWGMLHHESFSIEFNMGREPVCTGFMLHVRGGAGAVAVISRLLEALKLRAIDCQIGDFFIPQSAEMSFSAWQAFRDRVVQKNSSSGETPSA